MTFSLIGVISLSVIALIAGVLLTWGVTNFKGVFVFAGIQVALVWFALLGYLIERPAGMFAALIAIAIVGFVRLQQRHSTTG